MIFQAYDSWQVKNEVINVFDPPELRRYSMVELGINTPIFITELRLCDLEAEIYLWNTYLISDFDDVLAVIAQNIASDHKVSLLLPRCENPGEEFSVGTLDEVYDAVIDGNLLVKRMFIFTNGARYTEHYQKDSKLVTLKLVYKKAHQQ